MLTQQFDFLSANPIGQFDNDLRVLCLHIQFVASPIQATALYRVLLVDITLLVNAWCLSNPAHTLPRNQVLSTSLAVECGLDMRHAVCTGSLSSCWGLLTQSGTLAQVAASIAT